MRRLLRFKKTGLIIAWLVWWADSALALHPAGELAAAAAHNDGTSLDQRSELRYLTLYCIPKADRQELVRCLNYTLNAASRVRTIVQIQAVTPSLYVFDIRQFTSNQKERDEWHRAWEKIAKADPYFHIRSEVLDPKSRNIKQIITDAGWVDIQLAAKLRLQTGSIGPVLRADYFLVRANSTLDGGIYYDLAGIPATENRWFQSVGLNLKTVLRVRALGGANINVSGVTGKPRRIFRLQAALGGSYHTLDSAEVLAERSPLRNPIEADGNFRLRYDAGEYIATAPNGLMRYALYDANGKRQDAVPDNIAKDNSDPTSDGVLQAAISCVRCHVEAGIKAFACDFSQLTDHHVDLLSHDPELIRLSAEFYDQKRLERQIEFDRQTYVESLKEATGFTPAELVTALAACFRNFAYRSVTRVQAAREVGVDEATFVQILQPTRDPILLLLITHRPVLREQWEDSFAEAALTAATWRNASRP